MTSLESEVREEVRRLATSVIDSIIGAAEREAARQRAEACIEEEVALQMFRRLPRWRWLARLRWRAKHRRHASRCAAMRAIDARTDALCRQFAFARRRGEA